MNIKKVLIISSMTLFLNVSNAAELVQFSNGNVADANEINANFNELATRIQSQAATVGATGPKGDTGAAGPLAYLKCSDGEVAVASGGNWVCALSVNGASLPTGNISVQLDGVDQPSWQSWSGGRGGATYTAAATVGGQSSTSLDEVTLYGSLSDGMGNPLLQSNFRVVSNELGNWTSGISKFESGAIVLPTTDGQNSSLNYTTYATVGIRPEPFVLRSSYTNSSSAAGVAYSWWSTSVGGGAQRDDISIVLLDTNLNDVISYDYISCVPIAWRFDGVEEELTIQCDKMTSPSGYGRIMEWVNTISVVTGLNVPRDISVIEDLGGKRGKKKYNYMNSIPTRYEPPVLDISRTSSPATAAFTFRPNGFNVTDALVTDAPQ